jgi:hypothetical protein
VVQTFLGGGDLDANRHDVGFHRSTASILGANYFRVLERQTDADLDLAFGGTRLRPKRGKTREDG